MSNQKERRSYLVHLQATSSYSSTMGLFADVLSVIVFISKVPESFGVFAFEGGGVLLQLSQCDTVLIFKVSNLLGLQVLGAVRASRYGSLFFLLVNKHAGASAVQPAAVK